MRALVVVLGQLAVPILAAAQQPTAQHAAQQTAKPPKLTAAHTALSEKLARIENGLPLSATAKIRLLSDFLERFTEYPDHPLVLQSRSRLGDLYLLLRDPRSLDQFNTILEHAGKEEHDLRGRARYGLAQDAQLRGRIEVARDMLESLARDEVGTRYARLANLALQHLNRDPTHEPPVPGDLLVPFDLGRDLDGMPQSTTTLSGAPAMLVFWSPDSQASVRLLERLAAVWDRGGADPGQLVALSLSGDAGSIRSLAERRSWSFPVISCDAGFLDPVTLTLSVQGVPRSFLIGADSMLLARDLSPGRLAALMPRGR